MNAREPVFNEHNAELVILAIGGTIMLSVIAPLWLTALVAMIMFKTLHSFYKSKSEHLNQNTGAPKAMVFDSTGQFVGYTTYRVVNK